MDGFISLKTNCVCHRKHFVLVHGSCHGAWCWYELQSLLEEAGHKVTAIDLAAAGINPQKWTDLKCISDYFEPLFSFFKALPRGERVILVGHSRGGLAIGAASERFPHKISVAVYVTAYMLGPSFNIVDVNKAFPAPTKPEAYRPDTKITYDCHGRFTSLHFGPKFMEECVYLTSPKKDLELAIALARPYPYFDDERSVKELTLTRENFGSVKRVFIIAGKDRGISPKIAELFISHTPVNEKYEIKEADHMVMFSQPRELSCVLQKVATKF